MSGADALDAFDATRVLEALAGAQAACWAWTPGRDRLTLTGATRALGLSPLGTHGSAAALTAMLAPASRAAATALLAEAEPGARASTRLTLRSGQTALWSGVWLEDERRLTGLVTPVDDAHTRGRDALTGLLDRGGFVARLGGWCWPTWPACAA